MNRPAAAIWEGVGEDVIALHQADGRFIRVSNGAEDIFNVPSEQLMGLRLMDIIAPAHQDRLLKALSDVANQKGPGRARFEARVRIGEKLGAYIEMAISRAPKGQLRTVTRNIEHRLRREEAIREESQIALTAAEKRSEHLANMSHEIRTPLNAVIGFAEAMQGEQLGPMGNEKYKDYARVIHESGQHLLSLISDLLDLSKAEANEMAVNLAPEKPGDLIALCAEIMELRAREAGLYIRTDIEEGLGLIMLDAKVMRQILLNLISNALKFTEKGGVTISLKQDGAMLNISVVDTGVGMSPDELSIVGERFKQARSEGVRGTKGTGIGLSLSKALARIHGGELRIASAVGEGTTAVLRLPYRAAPTLAPSAQGQAGQAEMEAQLLHPQEMPQESNIMNFSDMKRA
ncbi:MAG: PAS domain-containing sensor histidine kinase [Pseudomonadota bacterium]